MKRLYKVTCVMKVFMNVMILKTLELASAFGVAAFQIS